MSNNINSITLECQTAKPLVVHAGENEFATVFAIHNRYVGKEQTKAVPINVLFSGRTLNLAKASLSETGTRFVVTGELDADERKEGGHFFSIRANQLLPLARAKSNE